MAAPHPADSAEDKRQLVVLQGVRKSFGDVQALVDIDLTVAAGEVVVLIGPSGSGKSTLCRCINRLETIDAGTILIDGIPLPPDVVDCLRGLAEDVGLNPVV